jgi:hypothetical protein
MNLSRVIYRPFRNRGKAALFALVLWSPQTASAESSTDHQFGLSGHVAQTADAEPTLAPTTDAEKRALWMRAIDAIEKNYARIKTIQGTLEQISVDPSVDRRETITTALPNGGSVTFTRGPVSVSRTEFILKGNDLRCDFFARAKDDWTLAANVSRRGDIWTFFQPEEPWAQIKRTEHLGGEFPFDPRNYGGLSEKHGLVDQMRRSQPLEIAFHDNQWHIRTEIVDAAKFAYRKGQQHSYVLDRAMNFLPTDVISYCDDGSINTVQELVYNEVIPHKAWFMREWTYKIFHPEKKIADASSNQWRSLIIARVVGSLKVDEKVSDDVFTINFPPGTRISDMVHRR